MEIPKQYQHEAEVGAATETHYFKALNNWNTLTFVLKTNDYSKKYPLMV